MLKINNQFGVYIHHPACVSCGSKQNVQHRADAGMFFCTKACAKRFSKRTSTPIEFVQENPYPLRDEDDPWRPA